MKLQRHLPFLGIIAVFIVGLVAAAFIPQVINHPTAKDVQGAAYQRLVTQTAAQTQVLKASPILTLTSTPTATLTPTPTPTQIPTTSLTVRYTTPTATPIPISSTITTANHLTSPTGSINGSVTAGATALCNDGTYSYAQHHQGACSQHGGVKQFYH